MQTQQTVYQRRTMDKVSISLINQSCRETLQVFGRKFKSWEDLYENTECLGLLIGLNPVVVREASLRTDKAFAAVCVIILTERMFQKPGKIMNPVGYYVRMTADVYPRNVNPVNALLRVWQNGQRNRRNRWSVRKRRMQNPYVQSEKPAPAHAKNVEDSGRQKAEISGQVQEAQQSSEDSSQAGDNIKSDRAGQ